MGTYGDFSKCLYNYGRGDPGKKTERKDQNMRVHKEEAIFMRRPETPNFKHYGDDADEAWSIFNKTGETDAVASVIADRIRKMEPKLLRQLFVMALVFARH